MKHIPQKSLSRFVRQLLFVPFLHNRWLTSELKTTLSRHIAQAEKGHRGEIRLIIENHLPIGLSYDTDCRGRALQLFGEYGVWDTAHNTGVLIYVNLCEKGLEIIADRGIDAHACDEWQNLCQNTLNIFKKGNMADGLTELIGEIGRLLNHYFPCDDTNDNELPDQVVYLR
ncbi:MAG: TPM domain-containing protein [Moraxella sp.]|nr:TPM domain-containing protein [Moraxella sp.]